MTGLQTSKNYFFLVDRVEGGD